jgi:hypothetical protein
MSQSISAFECSHQMTLTKEKFVRNEPRVNSLMTEHFWGIFQEMHFILIFAIIKSMVVLETYQ